MDNTKKSCSCLSLFTGYDGIGLGIEKALYPATIKTIAHVEIEAYAVENCVEKMEAGRMVPAPVWTDAKTFNAFKFRDKVDILTGGYPCQPFSAAGKRKGKEDPRHLWPYVRDTIEAVQPKVCFFENVEGHISLGLREVLTDLVKLGYRVENNRGEPTWGLFSAAEVGATHQRKRVFILAYSSDARSQGNLRQAQQKQQTAGIEQQGSGELVNAESRGPGKRINPYCERERLGLTGASGNLWPARPGEAQYEWEEPRIVVDPKSQGLQGCGIEHIEGWGECEGIRGEVFSGPSDSSTHGGLSEGETSSRKIKLRLGRTINGASRRLDPTVNRIDRLRLCGNGVVPQTAEKAFRTLWGRVVNPSNYVQPSIQMEMF